MYFFFDAGGAGWTVQSGTCTQLRPTIYRSSLETSHTETPLSFRSMGPGCSLRSPGRACRSLRSSRNLSAAATCMSIALTVLCARGLAPFCHHVHSPASRIPVQCAEQLKSCSRRDRAGMPHWGSDISTTQSSGMPSVCIFLPFCLDCRRPLDILAHVTLWALSAAAAHPVSCNSVIRPGGHEPQQRRI